MHSFETIDLGTYRGDVYFLKGFVEPEPSPGEHYDPGRDADGYGVVLVKKGADPLGENEQIVRMDTRHGQPHLDKVYLPTDADEDRKNWLEYTTSAYGDSVCPGDTAPSRADERTATSVTAV